MTCYTSNPPSTSPPTSSAMTSHQSIPSHPAPADAAATSAGVTVDASHPDNVSTSKAPTSANKLEKGDEREKGNKRDNTASAQHAMQHADGWKPTFGRRQSWNKEDQKRMLQMSGMQDK